MIGIENLSEKGLVESSLVSESDQFLHLTFLTM